MVKRSQRSKEFKFEIHCDIVKPVLKLLQGHIKMFEVSDFTSKYKELCECQFEITEGSIGFHMDKDTDPKKGIPSHFIPVLRSIVTSYYRGMILQDVVHVWYTVPLEKQKYIKYQADVV